MPMSVRFDDVEYMVHSYYDLYGSSIDGKVIHIFKGTPLNAHKSLCGDYRVMVRKYGHPSYKNMEIGQFVWECYNGSVPDGEVIVHIGNKADSRLSNLICVPIQDNDNSSKNEKNGKRDYSFVKFNHANRKCIKAINQDSGEVLFYDSMYAVQKHLGINAGPVKMVCENKCEIAYSKLNNCYTFEYVNKSDMPSDSIKSRDICPNRIPEEIKKAKREEYLKNWQAMDWLCPKCSNTYKNKYRYYHKQKCK